MKARLKSWITTIIGVLLSIGGLLQVFLGMFGIIAPVSIWTSILIVAFGCAFIMAKDSMFRDLFGVLTKLLGQKK